MVVAMIRMVTMISIVAARKARTMVMEAMFKVRFVRDRNCDNEKAEQEEAQKFDFFDI